MAAVDEVRVALERTVPDFRGRSGDWAGVLGRARSDERDRRKWGRGAVAVVAPVAAMAALVLFWPARHEGDGIIDRARAAVAGGPTVHVVLREAPVEVYDLERDEYGSVPAVHEEWFDPARGLHEVRRVGPRVVSDRLLPNIPARFSDARQQFAGVATAYRRALSSDEASLGAEETVQGRRVYWIRFGVDYAYWTAEHEVAVDAETFQPRFLRVDGGPVATVLTFEALPRGEGDFRPHAGPGPNDSGDARWSGPNRVGSRSPAEARAALRGALWLGERFRDLPLASIREARYENEAPKGFFPRSARALELCYGSREPCAVSMTQATTGYHLAARGHAWPFEPPPGTLAFGDEPGIGFVIRNGVYVALFARSRDDLIAAAKALTPIP